MKDLCDTSKHLPRRHCYDWISDALRRKTTRFPHKGTPQTIQRVQCNQPRNPKVNDNDKLIGTAAPCKSAPCPHWYSHKKKKMTPGRLQRQIYMTTRKADRLFRVETVEKLALAVFHVQLCRPFRSGIQSSAICCARTHGCEVRRGKPSRPACV
jgi:hypothetical protein